MVAVALPPGQQSFFVTLIDINGSPYTAPNAGGFVFMYEPGSTVPQTTWQDSAQTVANTNPIRLDTNGRCIIYGVGQYRQIVQDKNNNEQWDALVELGIDDSFVTQDLFNFDVVVDGPNPNPPPSTPVQGTRPLAAVLGSFVDARNFGALRQGGNDLTIIQSAINYAANIGGATVYVGPGPLTTTGASSLVWPTNGSGVSLKGDGTQATVLTVNGPVTVSTMVLNTVNHCEITDLGIQINNLGTATAAIAISTCSYIILDDLFISGQLNVGIGVDNNAAFCDIRDVLMISSAGSANGIGLGNVTAIVNDISIESCSFVTCGDCISIINANAINILGNKFESFSFNGVQAVPVVGTLVGAVNIENNVFASPVSGCFGVTVSNGLAPVGDISINSNQFVSSTAGVNIGSLPSSSTFIINGNRFANIQENGILNNGLPGVAIIGNAMNNVSTIATGSWNGIAINSANNNTVIGNVVGGSGAPQHASAVALTGTSDYCVVLGNVSMSSVTPFNNTSSGTHNVFTNNTGT